jgi:hypothetical protein
VKPSQRPPGSRPSDPPGWRLAFAIWESVRADGWTSVIKLVLLIAFSFAGMLVAIAALGPWPVIAGLAGAGIRPRRHC